VDSLAPAEPDARSISFETQRYHRVMSDEVTKELPKAYHEAVVHWQRHNFPDYPRLAQEWDRYFPKDQPFCLCAKIAQNVSGTIDVGERKALDDGLRSALAAVVVGVNATWGAIALREGVDHVVRASYHWKRVGARLPAEALNARELTTVMPDGSSRPLAVVAPLIAEADPLGAILLGQPKGSPTYGENDLDLVSEAADGLAEFVRYVRRQETQAREIGQVLQAFRTRERELQEKIEALGSAAMPEAVDPKYIARVEDALRRLYDYSYLGEHALALDLLAYHHAATHLDRGKALNAATMPSFRRAFGSRGARFLEPTSASRGTSSIRQKSARRPPTFRSDEQRMARSNVGWSCSRLTNLWPMFPVAPSTATGILLISRHL